MCQRPEHLPDILPPSSPVNRANALESLALLESQLNDMRVQLESLSTEAQTAKRAHLATDSVNNAMVERLHYLQAVKQLPADIETVRTEIEKLKPAHAVTKLRDGLLLLKTQLTHIYGTARSNSTLVNPIGRQHHRTWENTILSHSKSPMKRESTQRPDSIGMRLLLPSDTIRAMISLFDTISKHCISISTSWLENPENLERLSQVASRIAVNFRDAPLNQLNTDALVPELSSVELQLPQQLFWQCRTVQELKILLIGPPTQTSALQGSPRLFSPRPSSHADSKSLTSYIHSFGAASYIFDKYWTQIEPLVRERLSTLPSPAPQSLHDIDSYLREVHDINSRIWILTKMLWVDTPQIARHIFAHGVNTLQAYLDLPPVTHADLEMRNELPVQVPQLCIFSLPHIQVEQVTLRWAGFVDQALLSLYDSYAHSSPSLEDSMAALSQLNLFWANATTGPWYPMAKSGFSPSTLVLRFLPAVQSLRSAATTCARIIEHSKPEDRAAYADLAIWTQANPTASWLSFLTPCLCILVCCPGLLAVEDFLLDSLSTPLTNSIADRATATYRDILQFLSPNQAQIDNTRAPDSFWTHEAVSQVLDTLKLGSIKTVLLLRLNQLLKT